MSEFQNPNPELERSNEGEWSRCFEYPANYMTTELDEAISPEGGAQLDPGTTMRQWLNNNYEDWREVPINHEGTVIRIEVTERKQQDDPEE